MITVFILLAVAAFICTIGSAARPAYVPLWIAVLLICIMELLRSIPLGK
jgi:hypothetical protein